MEINGRSTRVLRATSEPFYPKDAFSISFGGTHHLTGNRDLFVPGSLVPVNERLKLPNGSVMDIVGRGCICRRGLTLPDVRYVPGLQVNVVSAPMLIAMDYDVLVSKGCSVIERLGGEVVGKATLHDGHYMVDYLRVPLHRSFLPSHETVEAAIIDLH